MSEIERIRAELDDLLKSLETQHSELKATKKTLQQWRSKETVIRNNILNFSKKIKALYVELGDYLEE